MRGRSMRVVRGCRSAGRPAVRHPAVVCRCSSSRVGTVPPLFVPMRVRDRPGSMGSGGISRRRARRIPGTLLARALAGALPSWGGFTAALVVSSLDGIGEEGGDLVVGFDIGAAADPAEDLIREGEDSPIGKRALYMSSISLTVAQMPRQSISSKRKTSAAVEIHLSTSGLSITLPCPANHGSSPSLELRSVTIGGWPARDTAIPSSV